MRHLLTLLVLAASAFAQTATISDTIRTPFNGTFSGTVTVSLNSPALAQPLYSGNVTLSGWTQTVTVTAGVFTLTLYTNDLITPGGTSYTATYAPTSGSGWKETWVVPTGATTIREIRSTTVPSPSVRFTPLQITQAGATLGQGLRWNGATWAPGTFVADPMTTTGDLITRQGGVATRVGIGTTGQVLTVAGGLPTWATNLAGNAATATALAADPANCSAGTLPRGVDASGAGQGCAAVALASEVTGTLPNGNTTAASVNTASAIVTRDASGNFAAGTVTAALAGNASTATALQTARTIAGTSFDGTANIAIASTGLSDSANLVRNNAANTYTAGNKQTFASNATTAGAAFGGGITADPSSVSAGDFWYRADLGTFGFRNATAVDALVAGGRALSTPGSVPFVTAGGVLGQSANLFWDNANGRLGVGTNAPQRTLHIQTSGTTVSALVQNASGQANLTFQGTTFGQFENTVGDLFFTNNSAAGHLIFRVNGTEGMRLASTSRNLLLGTTTDDGTNRLQVAGSMAALNYSGTSSVAILGNPASQGNVEFRDGASGTGALRGYIYYFNSTNATSPNAMAFATAATERMRLSSSGNLLVGTTTDGGFKLDVADSGSSGGLRVWDQRATIGSTCLVVRAGAGQGVNNLQTWQNNAGAALSYIGSDGAMRVSATFYAVLNSSGSLNEAVYGTDVQLASGRAFLFSATTDAAAAKDLAFRRFAAGRLELNSGTAIGTTPGNARDIMLRRTFAAETTTDPSAADLTIAGSNAQDVAAIYVKNDKLVVAYNRSGTVNYLTIPLDGATTTFTQSTTAP